MTLPPEKIGDKGQRFVVLTTGFPSDAIKGWQHAAYSETKEGAQQLMRALGQHPSVKHIRIRDRRPQ